MKEKTLQENSFINEANIRSNKIFTIPNLLSLFRICLIPIIVWLYVGKNSPIWTGVVLTFSGLTDIVDGYIARHFHMTSNLGKVLDPVADKLTQATVLLCLLSRFPKMLFLFIIFILKELIMGTTGMAVIRKTGNVYGANWHGKVTTCLLYGMMLLHIVWYDIPLSVSNFLLTVCFFMMMVSLVFYVVRNLKALKGGKAL